MENKLYINFSATKKMDEVDYYLKSIIRQAVKNTLKYEGFEYDAEVSVTLTDNAYIKKLNKEYRNKNSATDVLSFPLYDFYSEDTDFTEEPVTLGDIVISIERAKKQAEEIGNSLIREIAFLTIHSTLHLLGYDHERGEEDEEAQCRAQKEIIETIDF